MAFAIPGTNVVVKEGASLAMKECFQTDNMEREDDGMVRLLPGREKEGARVRSAFIEEARSMVAMQRHLPKEMRGNLRSGLMPVYHAGIYYGDGNITDEEERKHTGRCVYFYVMPFVEGGTLVKRRGRMSPGAVEALLMRMLRALEIMHSNKDEKGHPMMHRDIKPSNIMLTSKNTAVLIDYGGVTLNVHSLGYTSPEQLARRIPLPPASDIFSLGTTMYEIITGHLPTRVQERISSQGDPYEKELLNEKNDLVKQYEAYGLSVGRSQDWAVNFLYTIDLALTLREDKRWVSAEEWKDRLEFLLKKYEISKPKGEKESLPPIPQDTEQDDAEEELGATIFINTPNTATHIIPSPPEPPIQSSLAQPSLPPKQHVHAGKIWLLCLLALLVVLVIVLILLIIIKVIL